MYYTMFCVFTIAWIERETSELVTSSNTKCVDRSYENNHYLKTNYVTGRNFLSIFSTYTCWRKVIHYKRGYIDLLGMYKAVA